MISPVRIALEIEKARAPREAKDVFLDQLITRRELSIKFVRFNQQDDSLECASSGRIAA
jgi:hypothetical protein